jgi:hypothetical protein
MVSQKVDFAHSVNILGALKMFSENAKTRANTIKQLAFFNAEYLKCLSPKMLNVVRKTLFTTLSNIS